MSPPSKHKQRVDSALFGMALLVVVAGVGLIAAYEHGHLGERADERQTAGGQIESQGAVQSSSEQSESSETSPVVSAELPEGDPLSQPTLMIEGESSREIFELLTESERTSLERLAEVIDTTLLGKQSALRLSDTDWETAERYSSLVNPARVRQYWFMTAIRTPGYLNLKRLRDRGDADNFKSAAIAWAQLDGITRGLLLEILQAIKDEDEATLMTQRELMQQYPHILGIDTSELPLRAPRP